MDGDSGGGGMKLELPSLHLDCGQVAPGLWALCEPFVFLIDGTLYTIPLLFICDKYSIPKWPKWLRKLFPQNRSNKKENIPAWVHDYLVRHRVTLGISLIDCHDIFLQGMELVRIDKTTRRIKYAGVMVGNWAVVEKGDGTPPREVREFIAKHGWGC